MGFVFTSGHWALDLAGTVGHRNGPDRVDLLDSPASVDCWLVEAGLLDTPPAVDAEGLARTVALREAIYRLARARTAGRAAEPADQAELNRAAEPAPVGIQLLHPAQVARRGDLTAALSTLAREAIELLGGPAAGQLKVCRGDLCTRLFLDSSRRGDRRWCDMRECGNRAKAAAYRDRHATSAPH
ncbi:MAG TPA: ABATE domain-containing protein [Pseudonocardia sp.]|uniref:CGNR zinc finger domain-containing protein n=1 Tax=Pseudonocardia sp. TaxID=60912 RepID=UPI002C4B5801|nr:ABATE domain-containing protein [Pseudonocardia sp.]HTF46903.1 ABATE domain-containing protein [Pseudonocardia sp.]